MRTFWNIFPFFYLMLSLLQFLLWNTGFSLLPIITGVVSFISISIWFARRNTTKKENQYGHENKHWVLFFLFTLVIIIVELSLKYFYGFLGEYTVNIPIIFLCWNFLTMSQFKKNVMSQINIKDLPVEITQKWQLTPREVEISIAIIRGDSNKEIASNLNISFSTVKNHIYNIYQKSGAKSRVDLVNLTKQV